MPCYGLVASYGDSGAGNFLMFVLLSSVCATKYVTSGGVIVRYSTEVGIPQNSLACFWLRRYKEACASPAPGNLLCMYIDQHALLNYTYVAGALP